ncbi:iron ABC transporter substrate-binding protein [Nocardioides sp.]|uniref:iron ABC transporter substrate-binding protein n=1 Tax=Nocardioides sp. TaxID=35761 RepID=UPI002D16F012|nr:iron ABC transporter substrate-binding protein [Nocardioides sp.]HXH80537.1 iron ABC transporter substrate-binding protein [Nocardioides sp.]
MKHVPALAGVLLLGLLTAGCGSDEPKLVVYNAQHEPLLEELAPAFTEATGIEVELRNGKDLEMSNQLVQEGDASPADVFLTENSPAMSQVEAAGLFDPLPADLVEPIPEMFRPRSGLWTGFVARSTVLVYNTDQVQASELPASILDLAEPEWAGRISFSPTGADFQAIVAAVLELEGEDATRAWLEGLKANGTIYDGNNVVLEAVDSGESEVGIVYHYYWERDRAENGDVSDTSEQYYFGDQDPGSFVSVSGAGILASSDMKSEAREFIEFLVNEEGQQVLADSYALEYPLNPAIQLDPPVKPFSELQPPEVNVSDLDAERVVELMTEIGFL